MNDAMIFRKLTDIVCRNYKNCLKSLEISDSEIVYWNLTYRKNFRKDSEINIRKLYKNSQT